MTEDDPFFKEYDREAFDERREWYETQKEELSPSNFISGGDAETARLAEEQKYAFCHGLYFTTVVLGAAITEQSLHHVLAQLDTNTSPKDSIGLGDILGRFDEAGYQYLLDDVREEIKDLKENRVRIYHYRSPLEDNSLTLEKATPIDDTTMRLSPEIFQEEARHAVQTTFNVLEINWTERLEEMN